MHDIFLLRLRFFSPQVFHYLLKSNFIISYHFGKNIGDLCANSSRKTAFFFYNELKTPNLELNFQISWSFRIRAWDKG